MLQHISGSQLSKKTRSLKTRGIILGSKLLRETDKAVFIYTREHGKIRAVAKGALKLSSKFTGTIETLNFCDFNLYQGPRNTIITEVKQEKSFKTLRENLDKATSAILIAKIANELIAEHVKTSEIFDLIEETLKEIVKSNKTLIITAAFVIKLLDILGLLPDMEDIKNFHTHFPVKYQKLIKFLQENSFSKITKLTVKKDEAPIIKSILKDIIEYETEKPFSLPL
jgi:DNA repair protein RecO (recombination protein O)